MKEKEEECKHEWERVVEWSYEGVDNRAAYVRVFKKCKKCGKKVFVGGSVYCGGEFRLEPDGETWGLAIPDESLGDLRWRYH